MCFTSDSYVYRLPISDMKRRCFAFRNTSQPTRTAMAGAMAGVDGARTRSNSLGSSHGGTTGSPRTPGEPEQRRASVRLSGGGACCLLLPRCCLVSYSRSHLRTYALVASALVAPTSRSPTRQDRLPRCGMSDRNAARAIEHGQRPCDWTPSHLLPGLHRICSHTALLALCVALVWWGCVRWVSTCWARKEKGERSRRVLSTSTRRCARGCGRGWSGRS